MPARITSFKGRIRSVFIRFGYRVDDIHHSGFRHKQANSAEIERGEEIAMPPVQLGSGCVRGGHGSKFGRKKEEAIAALLSQRSIDEAARFVGVSKNTLARWLQIPEFKAAYLQARREAFGQAAARLQQASGAAVSTLLKIMLDQGAPAACRLRAADSVLTHAAEAFELEDIEMRVQRLEQTQNNNQFGGS
jgi:hypothetical protein